MNRKECYISDDVRARENIMEARAFSIHSLQFFLTATGRQSMGLGKYNRLHC